MAKKLKSAPGKRHIATWTRCGDGFSTASAYIGKLSELRLGRTHAQVLADLTREHRTGAAGEDQSAAHGGRRGTDTEVPRDREQMPEREDGGDGIREDRASRSVQGQRTKTMTWARRVGKRGWVKIDEDSPERTGRK